jgi:hypothetical protein
MPHTFEVLGQIKHFKHRPSAETILGAAAKVAAPPAPTIEFSADELIDII